MLAYILALDQGTTSSRAILFNQGGEIVSTAQKEFKQIYPEPGWVEHDPHEIWSSQISVVTECLSASGIAPNQIAAIGITNQRETTIVWDRHTGIPIYNAIVWQDRRTSAFCNRLKEKGLDKIIQEKTGLIIDAYFSATKIKWILDNVEGARVKAVKGDLVFGTVDSWLVWNLTGGKTHVTDVTNASRTMLFNINTLKWDEDLLSLFSIPLSMLPEVKSCSQVYAKTHSPLLTAEIPIAGIAGDQQASLFGQMCITKGMVKNTYGTGCFMLMNIGETPKRSAHQLITTIAWQINGTTIYAFEGSIFVGGAVVQWLRDGLGLIKNAAEVESLASEVLDNGGVYIVPAFAGLGAPHWNQDARGTIVGITRGTKDAHFARAALESICFQTMEVLDSMEKDSGIKILQLRVDGGATINNLLMQIQANILQTDVLRPQITDTTAMGAAYLAGLAIGFWKDISEIQNQWKIDKEFKPENIDIVNLKKGWARAVKAAKSWAED
ncbi:MAG: glycerol kinase GlpK [Ginsengibacter sp.]